MRKSAQSRRVLTTLLYAAGFLLTVQSAAARNAALPATPGQLAHTCVDLHNLAIPLVEISSVEVQPAGPIELGRQGGPPAPPVIVPEHCLVRGLIERRVGVGGRPYGIAFEMRLPLAWNHRFLFQGGGGINGAVLPAIGRVKGPIALAKGYAVVSQDAGHEGADASFGDDQQARIDMEYRSYERVTGVAKQVVRAFYGQPADHAYFMGCSEGGREAMLVSQRMPLEYDGVVAGDPGFLLGVSFTGNADRMTIAAIAPKGADGRPDYAGAFSLTDLKLVKDTVLADCDGKDGLVDGSIDNPFACHPKLERLICSGAKIDGCMTAAQVGALRTVFEGGRPEGSGLLTSGYFYDTAIDQPSWRAKLAGPGFVMGNGVNSIRGLFSTPYDPAYDDGAMDFVRDGPRFAEVGALNRADGVMYSSFRQHGAKLLIYTGLADQAFSARELVAYFRRLGSANGGAQATAAFARMFLVPGMTHCGGGQSLDTFDPLQAVVDWVEQGKAPVQMTATGRAFPGRSRPVCAYPLHSQYSGKGSIDDAANFACVASQDDAGNQRPS
jgi:hypothetical protein